MCSLPLFLFLRYSLLYRSSTRYKRELLLNPEWKNILEMTESAVEGLAATSGHPKIEMLKTIIQKHFAEKQDTRVMIFTQYRDSVQFVFPPSRSHLTLILAHTHTQRDFRTSQVPSRASSRVFCGPIHGEIWNWHQAKGPTQHHSRLLLLLLLLPFPLTALSNAQKFRGGEFNVLVATIIGEEGLDIGAFPLVLRSILNSCLCLQARSI